MVIHHKTSNNTAFTFALLSSSIFVAILFLCRRTLEGPLVVEFAEGETSYFDVVFQRQWGVVDAVGIPAIGIPPIDSTTTEGRRRRLESYLSIPLFTDVSTLPSAMRIGITQFPPTLPSTTTESYNLPVPIERSILRRWAASKIVTSMDDADYRSSWSALSTLATPRVISGPSTRPAELYSNAFALMGTVPYAIAADGTISVTIFPLEYLRNTTRSASITSNGSSSYCSAVNQSVSELEMEASLGEVEDTYFETYSADQYSPISTHPPHRLPFGGETDVSGTSSYQGDFVDEVLSSDAIFLYIRAYIADSLTAEHVDLLTRADARFRAESQRASSDDPSNDRRADYPSLGSAGLLDTTNRGADSIPTEEQTELCHIPYVYSHRVNIGRGSTATFTGQSLYSRLGAVPAESAVLLMMVQCSTYPLSVSYSISVENAVSGATVTSEFLSLPALYAALFGVYLLLGLTWLGYLIINVCFCCKKYPNGVQMLVLLAILLSAAASISGLSWAWSRLFSGSVFPTTDATGNDDTSDSAFQNPALLFNVASLSVIFLTRPLIAIGWGTFTTRMSLRMRSMLLVMTPVFATCALINHSCKGDGWRSTSAFAVFSDSTAGVTNALCNASSVTYHLLNMGSILVCWVLLYSSTETARVLMQSAPVSRSDEDHGADSPVTNATVTPGVGHQDNNLGGFELANARAAVSGGDAGATTVAASARTPLTPDCTDHFFKLRSLQLPFVLMVQFPIVAWVVDATLLSRRNTFIMVILIEVETAYFFLLCLALLRHRPMFI